MIELAYDLVFPEGAHSGLGIVLLHGLTSDRRANVDYARRLTAQGHVAMAIDLPGHGESPGDIDVLTRDDYLEAVSSSIVTLTGETDTRRVALVGSSFGAYIAALSTMRQDIAALVMRAPADYPDEGWDLSIPELLLRTEAWRDSIDEVDPSRARVALSEFDRPALIVESGADEVINPSLVAAYLESSRDAKYMVMEGAPHSIGRHLEHHEAYAELLLNFFADVN